MENMCKSYVIAIDGEAGTGKSTLAKAIAKKYNIVYMDTGAMYRCVTLNMINENISLEQVDKIEVLLDNIKIDMENKNGQFSQQNLHYRSKSSCKFQKSSIVAVRPAGSSLSKRRRNRNWRVASILSCSCHERTGC